MYEFYAPRPKQLFRFSEHRWVQSSLKQGSFRLNPASLANDDSLDEARRDDELVRRQTTDGSKVTITNLATDKTSKPVSDLTYTTTIHSDYFYLSFSEGYNDSLYTERDGADACLIINDVETLSERLHAAVESILPDWGCNAGEVADSKINGSLTPGNLTMPPLPSSGMSIVAICSASESFSPRLSSGRRDASSTENDHPATWPSSWQRCRRVHAEHLDDTQKFAVPAVRGERAIDA